ncbi:hypothetical protein RHSIM_Rhsim01G0140000 [Rhododendron simsii]|uniref:Pentatricopeptide repeat-containing protein n=1 Tax=Rhododendron simsii TaxID=118357 RepID=A0A834HI61_RHOSS|nr:hypothetical protein RHSIM_Rhsim01G0140000 [Rhododendron simsii]
MPPPKPLRVFTFFGRGGDSANSRGGSKAVPPPSLLIERLAFEIKGIEKLDALWFTTQKSSPDSKQRGERERERVLNSCEVQRQDSEEARSQLLITSLQGFLEFNQMKEVSGCEPGISTRRKWVSPNLETYNVLVKISGKKLRFSEVRELLEWMCVWGLKPDVVSYSMFKVLTIENNSDLALRSSANH